MRYLANFEQLGAKWRKVALCDKVSLLRQFEKLCVKKNFHLYN